MTERPRVVATKQLYNECDLLNILQQSTDILRFVNKALSYI